MKIKRHEYFQLGSIILSALFAFGAYAVDPPGILSHQGRIAIGGTNFNDSGYFKFSLVKDSGGGESILWHHDGTALGTAMPAGEVSVIVDKGHYSLLLGDTPMTAIPGTAFADNDNVSLRIWFSANSGGPYQKLSPDRRITTVGYAMLAKTAQLASTADVASAVVDGAITLEMLSPELRVALGFMEFVPVGNPGNADDPEDGDSNTPGTQNFGGVPNVFKMGKFEVTNEQYAEFLNAVAVTDTNGIYNGNMATDPRGGILRSGAPGSYAYFPKAFMAQKPVNWVHFWNASRFCNWLHNGKPTGAQDDSTTEDGAYTLTLAAITANSVMRNLDAKYFLPSENEWYKSAYHHPGGDSDDYWLYPTQSNDAPAMATADTGGDVDNDSANIANYGSGANWNGQAGNVTKVGSGGPGSSSHYGAFDMGGNVWEWNEAIPFTSTHRGLRGGSFDTPVNEMRSWFRYEITADWAGSSLGFRVASP